MSLGVSVLFIARMLCGVHTATNPLDTMRGFDRIEQRAGDRVSCLALHAMNNAVCRRQVSLHVERVAVRPATCVD